MLSWRKGSGYEVCSSENEDSPSNLSETKETNVDKFYHRKLGKGPSQSFYKRINKILNLPRNEGNAVDNNSEMPSDWQQFFSLRLATTNIPEKY